MLENPPSISFQNPSDGNQNPSDCWKMRGNQWRKIPAISFRSTQKPHYTPDLLSLFTKAPLLINERESYKVRPPSDVSWFWTHEYYSYTPPINRSRAVMCVNSALIWAAYIPYYISQQKPIEYPYMGGVLKYGYPEIIYRYVFSMK